MTWRSRIFFSLMLVCPAAAGDLSGTVRLLDSKEPSVRKKADYSGVVIWLEGPAVRPGPSEAHVRMVQKDKTFTPHILPVSVGATVEFPNLDPFFHNAFSNYDGQIFDIGLYPPKTSRGVRFTRPGIVRIFCNIHATMSAVIAVLDSTRYAVSGKDGRFVLADVPAGDYTLRVYHERATEATLTALTRKISVGAGSAVLPPLAVSETGYLPVPHQNKYGRAYPDDRDKRGAYPAGR